MFLLIHTFVLTSLSCYSITKLNILCHISYFVFVFLYKPTTNLFKFLFLCLGDNVEHMDHSTGTNDKSPELDIKFTNSLSYAERLLLKKHRRTDLDGLPTPRLDSNATTPRTYKTDSTTPRFQTFPEREDSFDSDSKSVKHPPNHLKNTPEHTKRIILYQGLFTYTADVQTIDNNTFFQSLNV